MALYKFGKKPAVHDHRTLMMCNYITSVLPPPPSQYNSLDRLNKNLGIADVPTLFPMDGNDQFGDCTMAAAAHAVTNYRGLVRQKFIPATDDVTKQYFDLSGGEDSGLVELDVLKYWYNTGLFGDKIKAFVKLAKRSHSDVKQAIVLFGGAYIGFEVQENAISDFEHHKIWEPGPTDGGGHAVYLIGYNSDGPLVLTWGDIQPASWEWYDQMVDEAYATLPPEAASPEFTPGFDFATLQKDLNIITA